MLNMKKLLTKLLAQYVTETFYNTAETLSSGTPGTFAAIQSRNVSKTGYTAIGVINASVGHPGSYHGQAFLDGSTLYMSFYRAMAETYSVPSSSMKVTVLYKMN